MPAYGGGMEIFMKVLMTTMKLDIGGAETHIIELSKALHRRGIEVVVASNGGAYVAELEAEGIRHIKIPFHSKNPACMLRAYKLLKELIFAEKFDIVHAHARIPAFLCAILHRRYHFRFVTTAHWVFSTKFPYNYLTKWGQRSLAVSDDIKAYLVENYGTNPDNIRVTINGIDLDKFSKNTDFSDVAQEFSLEDGKTRVVYVSRMDEDRSFAAHKLIEVTPDLCKEVDNLEVVIVGGGNDYDNILAEAEAVNTALGRRVIVTTGSRTDINKFIASGDMFIGVSRAALEAMACEKPSIIAGNEGYIGIFDEDKLPVSIATNFCCRGCDMTTAETLKKDILTILKASDEEKVRLGMYSRETVGKYYSINTMADDATRMYISVIKNSLINEVSPTELDDIDKYLMPNPLRTNDLSSDIMISGYYGFGNSGDDAILNAIVRELTTLCPGIRIVTLSNTPKETMETYGVEAVHRFNLISIFRRMRHTKLLISGGGSLIQDITSNKSLSYYLSIISMATYLGKKTMLYANGIGPVNNTSNFKRICRVLNKTDLITLREPASADELRRFGVDNPKILVTADPAFNLFPADISETEELLRRTGIPKDAKYCVAAIRPWKTMRHDFPSQLAETADYVKEKYNIETVFALMQPVRDTKISHATAELSKHAYVIDGALTSAQALGIINKAEFVIGMRLHALIYAAKCNTPVIGIVYDPKITSIMEYMGQKHNVPVENPNPLTLCRYVDAIMNNRNTISEDLRKLSKDLGEKARHNAYLALELIGEKPDTEGANITDEEDVDA